MIREFLLRLAYRTLRKRYAMLLTEPPQLTEEEYFVFIKDAHAICKSNAFDIVAKQVLDDLTRNFLDNCKDMTDLRVMRASTMGALAVIDRFKTLASEHESKMKIQTHDPYSPL